MKNTVLKKVMVLMLALTMCLGCTMAFASDEARRTEDPSGPAKYSYIVYCANYITVNSAGLVSCDSETDVQPGYTAGIRMDLQKLDGAWYTLKTWSGTQSRNAFVAGNWYVVRGTYRLKLTHTALNSSGQVLETVTKYSKTITY